MSMLLILKGLYNTINTPLYEKKMEFRTLVGGLNHSEKYESQLGWWNSQYFLENEIDSNQTTNQDI